MFTIDDYLDAAINNEKLRSDRALSIKLGLSAGSVNHFRMKKAWPSDATMIKIANLAQMDETEALLSLNIWRNMDGAAAPLYSKLLDKLKVAAMLGLAVGFIALSGASLPADPVAWGADQYILCKILIGAILLSGFTNIRLPSRVCV